MPNRLFLWFYAATYDLFNEPAERAGLREQRRDLLAQAAGATVEIGAGTGLNLPHYPPAVTRLVPLAVESVRSGELPKAPQIERPMIVGTARRPAGASPG